MAGSFPEPVASSYGLTRVFGNPLVPRRPPGTRDGRRFFEPLIRCPRKLVVLPIAILAPGGADDARDVPRCGENELHGSRINSCCRIGRSPWRDVVLTARQQERRGCNSMKIDRHA